MPKVNLLRQKKTKPHNHLAACLRGYKLSSGLTSQDIADQLCVTADTVRHQIARPADQWRIGDLKRFCDVIGAPYDEALQAAAKS